MDPPDPFVVTEPICLDQLKVGTIFEFIFDVSAWHSTSNNTIGDPPPQTVCRMLTLLLQFSKYYF